MLGIAMLASLVVLPLVRLPRLLLEPARPEDVNKMRAITTLSLIGCAAAAVLCLPLPYYVAATFEVQPRDAASVYVEVPGELRAVQVRSGEIAAGQTIAELADADAQLAGQRLLAQRADLVVRIESIRQRALTDDSALLELSQIEEALV